MDEQIPAPPCRSRTNESSNNKMCWAPRCSVELREKDLISGRAPSIEATAIRRYIMATLLRCRLSSSLIDCMAAHYCTHWHYNNRTEVQWRRTRQQHRNKSIAAKGSTAVAAAVQSPLLAHSHHHHRADHPNPTNPAPACSTTL